MVIMTSYTRNDRRQGFRLHPRLSQFEHAQSAAAAPPTRTKKNDSAASVGTPPQVSGLGAVSSPSGPRIREVCVESISPVAGDRCIRGEFEKNASSAVMAKHLSR